MSLRSARNPFALLGCFSVVPLLLALSGCLERDTVDITSSARQLASSPASSRATFTAVQYGPGGTTREIRGDFDYALSRRADRSFSQEIGGVRVESSVEGRTSSNMPLNPASFGREVTKLERNGRPLHKMSVRTKRILRQVVDGRAVEIYTVENAAGPRAPAAGVLVSIDGALSSITELERSSSGRLASARSINLDRTGKVLSEMQVDLRGFDPNSRNLSLRHQVEMRAMYHRLLSGISNLVLPDKLMAQAVEDDPCDGDDDLLVGAAAAVASAAVAVEVASFACAISPPACIALVGAEATFFIALGVMTWAQIELDECRSLHPPCFDGGFMTNGSCESAGSGSGGTGGGGGGGGGEGGGSGGSGGGSGGGSSIICYWETQTWYDGSSYHTVSTMYCI